MATLLENYKGRLSIAEKYYAQHNAGKKLSNTKKLVTAMCIDNTRRFINERFANSVGTQRADLGKFKQFCLDITTLTVPNLIVNDLFMVVPMSSFTGYLTYMRYALGTPKGGAGGEKEADPFQNAMRSYHDVDTWDANNVINDPFTGLGEMTKPRAAYSGERVVETVAEGEGPSWTPVVGKVEFKATDSSEDWAELTPDSEGKIAAPGAGKLRYVYDNQYIPQKALPTVVGRMAGIALTARARRIAVYYSQIAAFQA